MAQWHDLDDDDWQDMPVIHSTAIDLSPRHHRDDDDDDLVRSRNRRTGAWSHHHISPTTVQRHDSWIAPSSHPSNGAGPSSASTASMIAGAAAGGNATGKLIDVDSGGQAWKEKEQLDEMDYTRLELDDDPDEDDISMRTQYLFNQDKGMTPLSQMQTTKTLLTEGQRIAYVGLCRLVAREIVQTLVLASKGAPELAPARESCKTWSNKIMGRLYRHMEVDGAEQRMIEQLAEHGVTAQDLTPSLMSTYTVSNPEYDPEAAQAEEEKLNEERRAREQAEEEQQRETRRKEEEEARRKAKEEQAKQNAEAERIQSEADATRQEHLRVEREGKVAREVAKLERRASLARQDPLAFAEEFGSPATSPKRVLRSSSAHSLRSVGSPKAFSPPVSPPTSPSSRQQPFDGAGGDIGAALDSPTTRSRTTTADGEVNDAPPTSSPPPLPNLSSQTVAATAPAIALVAPDENEAVPIEEPSSPTPSMHQLDNFLQPMPSSLPGVTTKLSTADKEITLDVRWTILCDLFLSLIADSVYDARSRVLLCMIADKLGLEWIDVVRFERRLTEALEIQENVKQKEHLEVLEERRVKGQNKRYVMMGLATLGGGLVIGLSAGLLAPVIGAGLGAALTTVGVSGTTGFLAGAGGAAIISSGATLTGATIGGKAMAKRTRHVKTFEFLPLHNNKRVNFLITIPGFMNGPLDDVRLPFSPLDPLMGDVFSVLWEPEMMGDTGNALKILSTEVLTQAGQQVLALTVMTALMSALQWPMMLTKLSYLIDNPWSNALDRARQAGAVLADILINRQLGVRPVTLVGFSLGARVIFYALVELAKANAFGVVQEVYLFGATVTASMKVWRQVRGIVAGRFVNAFAMNDWVLGYLFRATSGGLQTVAGLRPIEHVPDLENVDITNILVGHMSYRTLMPTLLKFVGFKVTADHFDEPEEMEPDAPEREVLTAAEEQERLERKSRKKVLGLFSRSKKTTATPSAPMSRTPSRDEYDDLPPRMSSSSSTSVDRVSSDTGDANVDESNRSSSSISTVEGSEVTNDEDSPAPSDPSTSNAAPVATVASGFDLNKIRAEVAQLPTRSPSSPSSIALPLSSHVRSRTNESDDPEVPPVPQPTVEIGLARPQTDLTNLDTTLDPRELLRRQWAGEVTPSSSTSAPTTVLEEYGWHSPTTPIARSRIGEVYDPDTLPPSEPTFAFSNDTIGRDSTPSWAMPTPKLVATHVRDDDEVPPERAGAPFVWGTANASTVSLRENPW
ncbi:BQ2448_2735 [Microbotryum intermedium]|uniref:BQ2448_2735 protein n=1 Tax=Microbotryum intermedium TaxID=269621 RepID=A0A238FD91_9BASI|nr:BQ2448_2735 [Microbotryum intermedium]